MKKNQLIRGSILLILVISFFCIFKVSTVMSSSKIKYYSLSAPELILKKGYKGTFDSKRTHTMSIVELNKNGYRFWGYYHGYDGNNIKNDMGLAYSNDLLNWVKEGPVPVIRNLRWGTVEVVDGVLQMFGTRNYGGDSYIVRLSSKDGKNFKEEEVVVPSAETEKNQNPFIFYDEKNEIYRLYFFHYKNNKYYIEEKSSADIMQINKAKANMIFMDSKYILAAPSMMYRDGRYWLSAETLRNVKGKPVWKTIMYSSNYPNKDFTPVEDYEILVNDEVCYFQHIFDNKLIGIYSHRNNDDTWELYRRVHNFPSDVKVKLNKQYVSLKLNEEEQLNAVVPSILFLSKNVTNAVTWATSNNLVASIKKGKVKALSQGTAIITASYGGSSTTTKIDVK